MVKYPDGHRHSTADLTDDGLRQFARELLAAGFNVYVSDSRGWGTYFKFGRVVDGVERVGYVQVDLLSYKFSMPIKPSREHGSGMFVAGAEVWPGGSEKLTVANATLYASPSNRNHLVGTHQNYNDPSERHQRMYVAVSE